MVRSRQFPTVTDNKLEKGKIMKKRIILAALAALPAFAVTATPAQAQATRTFVSALGDDANPCSRTAPCRTFAGTISKTATGGEINCIDPGSFGTVTIAKSITIDCIGAIAGQTASTTTGIVVNPPAGSIVTIRNVSITGAPTALPGNFGIRVVAAVTLNLENVNINNFRAVAPNGVGISITNATGLVRLYVSGGVISNNGTATSGAGISVAPTGSGSVNLFLNNVQLTGNWRGIAVNTTGTTAGNSITVTDSRIFGSIDNGVDVATNANAVNLVVEDSTVSNNLRGFVLAGAGATLLIGDSTVVSNGTAFFTSGGAVLQSYKDNNINLNTNNGTPITQVGLN